MNRMPASAQRVLSAAGMVLIAPAAGLILLVALLYEAGAYENTTPSEEPHEVTVVLAAGGLVSALAALYGLIVGSRRLTWWAAIVQASCVVLLGVLLELIDENGIGSQLSAGLVAVIAVDVLAVWAAARDAEEEPPTAHRPTRWTLTASPMALSLQRHLALASMAVITAIGTAAVLIEYLPGGPFNLRLAGGAGLLAAPSILAIFGLLRRSRQIAAAAAIVQGVTAGLLLLLWDSPRWHDFGEYDEQDAAFNLYLVTVLIADCVLLRAAARPERKTPTH